MKLLELKQIKAYSFASKVYNFIFPNQFPIIDSYTSTLLWEYMTDDYKNTHSKSEWGNYKIYKSVYDKFRKEYDIEKTYKEIDIFLWTYASVLQEYWKKEGVLVFNMVSYKGPK